jgi:pyruvate dehydrogenase E2 component (dihydrolipoamide acetyltransferase)
MATPVIMPRQGQSVESCIFSEWHVAVGSKVSKGDLLFSYETDKAAFEGESPEEGVLLGIFAAPGDEVPVLQNIAVIGREGEDIESFRPGNQERPGARGEPGISEEVTQRQESEKMKPDEEDSGSGFIRISPRAKKASAKFHVPFEDIEGSGPGGRIIERDILEKSRHAPRATPLARSISLQDHLDLPSQGSGPGGKITAADIRNKTGVVFTDDFEEVRISNIRKIIAENMHASLQNTAQLTLHTSADARRIKMARDLIKAEIDKEGGSNITINDMVCYATVQAILKHPGMNAHFLGETIRRYTNVHLGFAVDTKRGLMVPTIRNANHLKLAGMSASMKELAVLAQEGNIDPSFLKGATFTVTNLGAFGIEIFTPVLNPPQVGILGINTITYQPAQLDGGSFGFIPKIGLSLTFDHRAIDGAPAAAFLKEVKDQVEKFGL